MSPDSVDNISFTPVSSSSDDSSFFDDLPDISLSVTGALTSAVDSILGTGEENTGFAPNSSFLKNVQDPTYHIVGYSTKDVKTHFQDAWKNDRDSLSKKMASLKMGGRCLGFATSVIINITSRAVAFAFSVTTGTLTGLYQFTRHPIRTFKDPKKAMDAILGGGAVGGVLAGGAIGGIGELLIRASLSIDTKEASDDSVDDDNKHYEYQRDPFIKATEDNLGPTVIGTILTAGVACIYPAMWQLPFKSSGES